MRNNSHPGRFIALEGIDGSGKTLLGSLLSSHHNIHFVPRRLVPTKPAFVHEAMLRLSQILWEIGDSRDLDAHFWMMLQSAWFNAHSAYVVEPLLAEGKDVIVDGWVYKFFAKLDIQGYSFEVLKKAFSQTLKPDRTIIIDAPVAKVVSRKAFRPTELGLHAGYKELGERSFIHYQQRIRRCLMGYSSDLGWEVLRVPARCTPGDLAERVLALLRR